MSAPPTTIDDIRGWFPLEDRALFAHFLSGEAVLPRGDLVELGTYLGKSAVLIGEYLNDGERFFALDLFDGTTDDSVTDESNVAENNAYRSLTRSQFEENYLAFHDALPEIIVGQSTLIVDHVNEASVRFFHIDASHLYEHVAADLRSAKRLTAPGGVVVLDDYRSLHTPGVAAAAWEAAQTLGFKPFLLSTQKMYGTFDDDTTEHRRRALRAIAHDPRWKQELQQIMGQTVVRAVFPKAPRQAPVAPLQRQLRDIDHRLARLERRVRKAGRIRDRQFRVMRNKIDRSSLGLRLLHRLRG